MGGGRLKGGGGLSEKGDSKSSSKENIQTK